MGNMYERYSDDVIDPFDAKELVINLNRILYNNTYTLDFNKIAFEDYSIDREKFVRITNLPFPDGYHVITAEKQYTLADANWVEVTFKLLKAKSFLYGVYSKRDILHEYINAYHYVRK